MDKKTETDGIFLFDASALGTDVYITHEVAENDFRLFLCIQEFVTNCFRIGQKLRIVIFSAGYVLCTDNSYRLQPYPGCSLNTESSYACTGE